MVDFTVGDDGIREEDDLDIEELETAESDPAMPEPLLVAPAPKKPSLLRVYAPHAIFAVLALIYLIIAIAAIDNTYVDFGDGNYLYLSWRVLEGDRLYRDLPSPQPPLHLLFGASLLGLGGLAVVRTWMAVQHVLIACMVWTLGEEVGRRKAVGGLAASLYLFLPEGFWWAMGYQSEGLEILLLTFGLVAYVRGVRSGPRSPWILLSGFSGCLAVFTNMTAVVYVGLQVIALLLTHRTHAKAYLAALLGPGVVLLTFFVFYSEGEYIHHVWSRQISTYESGGPVAMFWEFLGRLLTEGGDIAEYEGAIVALAVVGMLLFSGIDQGQAHRDRNYLIWWGMASIGSILFATKGGTVEYIFTLGEPAVAVFCAFFLHTLFLGADIAARPSPMGPSRLLVATRWLLLVAVLVPVLSWRAAQLVAVSAVRSIAVVENTDEGVNWVTRLIRQRAPQRDDPIFVPAHYAFIAKRPMAQHISSTLILYAAYYHEYNQLLRNLPPAKQEALASLPKSLEETRHLDEEARGYTQNAIVELVRLFEEQPGLRPEYPAVAQFIDLRNQLRAQEIPIVVLNLRHMVTSIPLLQEGINNYYRAIDLSELSMPEAYWDPRSRPWYDLNRNLLMTREEQLRFYEPRHVSTTTDVRTTDRF